MAKFEIGFDLDKTADIFMLLKRSELVPLTMAHTLKVLHFRESGPDLESFTRPMRGDSIGYWDRYPDDDSMADDDLCDDPDLDVMAACDNPSEDRSGNKSTSNCGKSPSINHSTASLESPGIAEMSRRLCGLLKVANWVFGPDGLLSLQVLAIGDFSYNFRSHNQNNFFCRRTCSIQSPGDDTLQPSNDEPTLIFRPMRKKDRDLWELVDRNMGFLKACPTDAILDC